MTFDEVKQMMDEIGMPTTYMQWPTKVVPPLPFTVFYYPNSDNFGADDQVYVNIAALNIELYTAKKSPQDEKKVEDVLKKYNLFWNKTEAFLTSELMYEVLYETEIILNG